jgi:hypothetical protein
MEHKIFCNIVATSILLISQTTLFVSLAEFRYNRKKSIIATIIAVCAVISIHVVGEFILDFHHIIIWNLCAGTIPMAVFLFLAFKYKGARFFTTYCVSESAVALVDLLAYILALGFFPDVHSAIWIMRCIADLVVTLHLIKVVGKKWRNAINAMPDGWIPCMLMVVCVYVAMFFIASYPTDIEKRRDDIPSAAILIIIMICFIILSVKMICNMYEVKEEQLKTTALQNQLYYTERKYALIQEEMGEIRRIRHDMKHHINAICEFLENGDCYNAMQYAKEYREVHAARTQVGDYTKNDTVNILASYYMTKAKSEGIRTQIDIQIPQKLPIDQIHLITLIGNVWDNAYSACHVMSAKQDRFINTVIRVEDNNFIVKCKNSVSEVKRDQSGGFITTKGKGHGNGLNSIKLVVEAYSGFYSADEKDGIFTFSAVLKLG